MKAPDKQSVGMTGSGRNRTLAFGQNRTFQGHEARLIFPLIHVDTSGCSRIDLLIQSRKWHAEARRSQDPDVG